MIVKEFVFLLKTYKNLIDV